MFLSRIFINKVLSITKAVVNYDHYLLQSLKASSKLNRVSLGPKRNNMFISVILMMAHCCNWLLILFSNMVLSRVTLYWSGNVTPCYYMDRLRDKKINNNKKKHRSKSEDESVTEIVETWVGNGWWLGWPERVGYWILESSFMSWLKAQWKTESDYVYCLVI